MVGTLCQIVSRIMWHILLLRNYCLLANHAITLFTVLLQCLFQLLFETDTTPSLIITWNTHGLIAVREVGCLWIYNILDLSIYPFLIIFGLDCGQEVTSIFMIQGTIFLLIIPQLILHIWRESILIRNLNIMYKEFFVAGFPISFFITISFIKGGGTCFANLCISWMRLV